MSAHGCFVSGTDTGAGKTVVGRALVRGLRARGIDVGARAFSRTYPVDDRVLGLQRQEVSRPGR